MNCASKFKTSLIQFLDELIEQFPTETDLIFVRFALSTIDPDTVITHFIQKILPFKDIIIAKDDEFFLDNSFDFFENVNKSKVNHFKCIWKSSRLDDEDREIIWKWFETFVQIAEKYTGNNEK